MFIFLKLRVKYDTVCVLIVADSVVSIFRKHNLVIVLAQVLLDGASYQVDHIYISYTPHLLCQILEL